MPGLLSGKEASYEKTHSNLKTELAAKDLLLQSDSRFQEVPLAVKKRILIHFGFEGRLPVQSFDLIYSKEPLVKITIDNINNHLDELIVVEMKATKNKNRTVRNDSLRGFFFGATENEFNVAERLGDRYQFAFVVLSSNNDYGRPFYVLQTLDELKKKIKTKRTQFQINL